MLCCVILLTHIFFKYSLSRYYVDLLNFSNLGMPLQLYLSWNMLLTSLANTLPSSTPH